MQSPEALLTEVELRILCPCCKLILCRPRTFCPDNHAVCRICLDQLLQSPQPKCPTCHHDILEPTSVSSIAEQLVECYYTIKHHLQSQADSTWRAALQKTTSALTDCTVDTIENPSSSFLYTGLEPLISSADFQMDSGDRNSLRNGDELFTSLPLSALSDSDDTDLDLPDPSSFLMQSPKLDKSPAKDAPKSRSRSPSHVPETPEPERTATMVEPHVSEAIDSQNPVGRKRKQPAVAKASEVDSNLTLLDENVADKAEPRAKKGRARASLASSTEKSVRSRKVDDAVTGDSAPRLCLLVTGLSEAQTTRLRRACQQAQSLGIATISLISSPAELLHDAAQARKDTPKFTHVVTSPNKGGRTARTFKYLVGLVSGAWVVKLEWLLDSVKAKKLLTESEYVISGDTAMPQYALFGPRPVGQLLAGYSIYVWSDEKSKSAAHTPDELMDLIRVAGGEIKTKCPAMSAEEEGSDNDETNGAVGLGNRTQGDKAISTLAPKYRELFEKPVHKDKTIILVDTGDKATTGSRCASFLDTVMEQAGGGLACRSKSWLFDCISANTII